MIYDRYENRHQYYNCHKDFAKAFAFIGQLAEQNLAPGKYAIDGDNVFAIVQEYTTGPKGEEFEAHKTYIDIQYILAGQEAMECSELSNCRVATPYVPEKDVAMYVCDGMSASMEFEAGNFAIFFPWDAHKPAFMLNNPAAVKKVIVKVRV